MRHLLVSVLLAFVIPAVAQEDHNGLYLLKCGNTTMTIDGIDDALDVFVVHGVGGIFGTILTAFLVQAQYGSPVDGIFFGGPVDVLIGNCVAIAVCAVLAFVVTYSIVNESDEVRKVAPWEITRVQNEGGLIFFEAPVEGITPAGLMNFKDAFGAAWYQADETSENRKINADGKGWLASCCNGLLLVKRFDDLDASQPAPDEAEIQVYVNRGKTYIELESQGTYTTLQPKEKLSWTVCWYLQPCEGTPTPSEALLQQVRHILGK